MCKKIIEYVSIIYHYKVNTSSVKYEGVEKLLEWEQGFFLTNVDLKLLGFKPFERKVLSKWNVLYPSGSQILHQNLMNLWAEQP